MLAFSLQYESRSKDTASYISHNAIQAEEVVSNILSFMEIQ